MSISQDATFLAAPRPTTGALATLSWSFGFFLYALFLHWAYINVIQPEFYWELKLSQTYVSPLTGALLTAMTSLAAPKRFAKPSDLILLFAFIVHIAPAIAVSPHYEAPLTFNLAICSSFILICILASLRPILIQPVSGGIVLCVAFALICMGITFAAGIQSGRLSMGSLSLASVYEFRTVSDQAVRGGITQYISTWTANFLVTTLFIAALLRRKYLICGALLAAQMALFLMTREKLTLFIPAFGLIAYWAFERGLSPLRLFAALVAVIIIGAVLSQHYNFDLLNTLVVRRIFFAPAALDALYRQVFDVYGLQYWSQFLGRLSGGGGGLAPAVIVGATMANSAGELNNAGTGYIGSGYMQAGYIGIFVYAFLIGLLFYAANSLTLDRVRNSLATTLIFFPIWAAINDTDLPSAIMTQGIFLVIIGLWLMGTGPGPTREPRLRPFRREEVFETDALADRGR
jgi:hypothetical protein